MNRLRFSSLGIIAENTGEYFSFCTKVLYMYHAMYNAGNEMLQNFWGMRRNCVGVRKEPHALQDGKTPSEVVCLGMGMCGKMLGDAA